MTPGAHLSGVLGVLATLTRALWFLAFAVLAGATAWAWAFGAGASLDAGRAAAIDSTWRDAARRGWAWTCKATLLSLLVVVIAGVTAPNRSPIQAETLVGTAVLGLALALLRQPVRRLAERETAGGRAFTQDRWALTWLLVPVAVGAAMMAPTQSRAWEAVRAAIAGTHLGSAGVWLGTIGLFVVLVRGEGWRSLPLDTAGSRPFVRPVIEIAGRSAAVLVVSGIAAAAVSGDGLGRWTSDYATLLAAKALVLGVAVAIAWRQWVVVHGRTPSTRLVPAAVVEAVALLASAGIAAALIGVDPVPAASAAGTTAQAVAVACMTGAAPHACDASTIRAQVAAAPAAQLGTVLTALCTADPAKPNAYTYFTCLQSVGQALADKEAHAPAPALSDCSAYGNGWAEQSCAAGVFNGLLTSETAAGTSADTHASDPVWPCASVPDDVAAPCYLLAPTRVMWLNGGDVHAAFQTCDHLTAEWRDMCYQGTGREISTRAGYSPAGIAQGCSSAGALGPGPCLAGAARTLVFTHHADAAAALCAGARPSDRAACDSERQAAVATL